MRRIFCLMGLLLLATGLFQATAQNEPIEWINTFGRGTINQAILSADGERLVVVGNHGIWVYDNQFNDINHIDIGAVQRVEWAYDDLYLAVFTVDGRLTIWNMTDYQFYSDVNLSYEEQVQSHSIPMTWKPNSHVLTLADRTRIALWNADTKIVEATLPLTTQTEITDIAWNPDGTQLAIAANSEIQLWDSESATPSIQIDLRDSEDSPRRSVHLAWSPDGTHIAATEGQGYDWRHSVNNTLSIINTASGETTVVIQAGLAADVAWSPDGMMLATATAEFSWRGSTPIKIWDMRNGRLLAQLYGHTREAHTVQWYPDSQHLLSAANDNTARVWQIQPGSPVNLVRDHRVLRQHMGRVNVLAWSPNGTQLAVGSEDGDIRVWDITSGEMYITDYQVDAGGIQALDYSPDGRYLAAGTGANLVHVWALTDDAVLISGSYEHGPSSIPGEGNPGGITAVAWSPDSSTLASAGYDAQIKLFPVVGDVRTLRQGGWFATSLHWFADSIHLLAGEHNPEIWNTVSGEQLPIPCANDPQLVLALSPDEHYLLLDEGEGPYYLCDIFTGEQSPTISLNILDWNPVYPVVAAVDSTTHKITLFDPPTFGATTTEAIAVIPMVTQVQTAAWSPDGRYLAIGLADGTVQLFALQEYRTG